MKMEKIKPNWLHRLSWPAGILGAICGLLYLYIPEGASEEYLYTVKIISYFSLPLLSIAVLCNRTIHSCLKTLNKARFGWQACGAFGLAFILVPILAPRANEMFWIWGIALSVCWMLGAFLLAFSLFLFAARINNWASGLVCLAASLLLALCLGEAYFLFSSQIPDGKYFDGKSSHYVKEGKAISDVTIRKTADGVFPAQPDHPSASFAHRELRFGQLLYDVRCTLDKLGRRITPQVHENPQADVLVFGCSFTFGHGLENEQSWPWKLGELLGPDWKVVNYGYFAFGPQQMLNYLESGHVEKPTAPFRQAFYLGIKHQLLRYTGLFFRESSWYVKEGDKIVRKGLTTDSPYYYITSLPSRFNGSQLAENIYQIFSAKMLQKKAKEFAEIYVWILKQSAKILLDKYQTPLTILLWPDLEWLAPDLDAANIDYINLRPFLSKWDEKGEHYYQIVPDYESHPNDIATTEIAVGLAHWLEGRPGAPAEAAFTHAAR